MPKEDLLECLYLEFVNRVNEVGIDINQTLAYPYTVPLLQFVCGLGPRKSSQIIKVGVNKSIKHLLKRSKLIIS